MPSPVQLPPSCEWPQIQVWMSRILMSPQVTCKAIVHCALPLTIDGSPRSDKFVNWQMMGHDHRRAIIWPSPSLKYRCLVLLVAFQHISNGNVRFKRGANRSIVLHTCRHHDLGQMDKASDRPRASRPCAVPSATLVNARHGSTIAKLKYRR